jgi:peroxiredoxin Q/BCP
VNRPLICAVLAALLLLSTGCMPVDYKKLVAANEVKLGKEGLVALSPGDPAPAFSAVTASGEPVAVGPAGPGATAAPDTLAPGASAEGGAPGELPGAGADPSADGDPSGGETAAREDAELPKAAEGEAAGGEATGTQSSSGPVLLFFYPANDTPNSAKHLADLAKMGDKLAAHGISAYGVNPGSAEAHQQFARSYGIELPLVLDEGGRICQAYGCLLAGGTYPQRTTVGVATDGTVAFYQRGVMLLPAILKGFGVEGKEEAE